MLRHVMDGLLRVIPAGADVFTSAATSDVFDRVYGGQMLAQALLAAAATVAQTRPVHSAHCSFLRLGDPKAPIVYRVERVRDTRAFSNRVVRGEQGEALIFLATFSFCEPGEGLEHQWAAPAAAAPEDLWSRDELLVSKYGEELPANAGVPWPIDIRHVNRRPWDKEPGDGRNLLWMRADAPLPNDPLVHACLLLYASDLTMVEPVTARHPIVWEDLIGARGYFGASLDHSFWLHEQMRLDDWLLHEQESPRGGSGRGLATGRFFDRAGVLVASVAQEITIRKTGGKR